jgi:hypothetical protein
MVCNDASKAEFAKAQVLLQALDAEYGSELGYERAALEDIAMRETIICKQCNFENSIETSEQRMLLCKKCKKEIWLTADTFYHKARLFRPRIVIPHIFEHGIVISINQAAELLDVSNHTAKLVYAQAGIVVTKRIAENAVDVPSQFCIPVVCRRSTQTPAREHPAAEELAVQQQLKEDRAASEPHFESGNLNEQQRQLLAALSDEPATFEYLSEKTGLNSAELSAQLMHLELLDLVQSCPGNKFKLAVSLSLHGAFDNPAQVARAESLAKTFSYFIKDYFQGVSRKYLQIYASLHWISQDRKCFPKYSLRKLFASHSHISYDEILAYVTPPAVRMVTPFNTS